MKIYDVDYGILKKNPRLPSKGPTECFLIIFLVFFLRSNGFLNHKRQSKSHDLYFWQGRLEACSTCSKHTGADGAASVNKAPNALGNGAKRQMNTVKFWLEPALIFGELEEPISLKVRHQVI
jgi:hypothetical protein